MRIEESKLHGVKEIYLDEFEDHRGGFVELYNQRLYSEGDLDIPFVQDDISVSSRNVLRGVHGDAHTHKLVSCIWGKVYLLIVNNDPQSDQYLKWTAYTLSDKNRMQILIPPRFGNGHLVLSETAIFHYKQSAYYDPRGQFTLKWDEPKYGFWWPVKDPILSRRDELGGYVS